MKALGFQSIFVLFCFVLVLYEAITFSSEIFLPIRQLYGLENMVVLVHKNLLRDDSTVR